MKRYKLIALDMDGTVLDDRHRITNENEKWINKALEAGITVSFATGRSIAEVLPFTTEMNLNTPIVTVNGSETWQNPKQLINRHLIDAQWVERFAHIAIEQNVSFWINSVEGKYTEVDWHPDLLSNNRWLKLGIHTDQDHIREHIFNTINEWGVLEITNSHPHNLEMNPKGVNKASGLRDICNYLGIEMSEVVAMGDSTNDLAMIRSVGLGVAMGNAQDQVKEIADVITDTNNEDGVAKIIRDIVL